MKHWAMRRMSVGSLFRLPKASTTTHPRLPVLVALVSRLPPRASEAVSPDPADTSSDVEIVFVHPSYHKQGIGSSLVVHATSLADEQGVPAYLDAESKAVGIYQKAGFVLQSDVEKKSEMASMLRPAKGKEA